MLATITPNMSATSNPKIAFYSRLLNEFFLPPADIALLEHHYILHWTGAHLRSRLSSQGIILVTRLVGEDTSYICNLSPAVKDLFFSKAQLKLSFRKPRDASLFPIVLVRYI